MAFSLPIPSSYPSQTPSRASRASTTAKRTLYLLVVCILIYLMYSYSAGEHTPHNLASTGSSPLDSGSNSISGHKEQSGPPTLVEEVDVEGNTTDGDIGEREGEGEREEEEDVIVQKVETEVVMETASVGF